MQKDDLSQNGRVHLLFTVRLQSKKGRIKYEAAPWGHKECVVIKVKNHICTKCGMEIDSFLNEGEIEQYRHGNQAAKGYEWADARAA